MSSASDQDIQEFMEEALPILYECENALLEWEKAPNSTDILDHIFRCFHSLKGISCLFEFDQIDGFIHKAETILSHIRTEKLGINGDTITTFLKVIAALRVIIDNLAKNGDDDDEPEDYEILVAELRLKTLKKQVEGSLNANTLPQTDELAFTAPIASPLIRVQARQLDGILSLVNQLQSKHSQMEASAPSGAQREIGQLILQLKDKLALIQKRPIYEILDRLPNMVRKFALTQTKLIHLEIKGGNTLVATHILESITDPIIHLVRNSMDHGIETVTRRLESGKHNEGRILIKVHQEGGKLYIEISDDGQGIDPQTVLRVALQKNLITPDEAQALTLDQTYNLLLLPGFSTTNEISLISGRGVGLNIVKANLEKIGGKLQFSSILGRETKIELIVPEMIPGS